MDITEEPSFLLRVEVFANTLNHGLIAFTNIYMAWMFFQYGIGNTALHGILCLFGYNLLMAEAIMSHYKANVLTNTYSRKTKTTIHWVMMTIGGGLGIAGTVVKILHKSVHFKTLHGQLGLASLILCGISLITGLSALYSTNLRWLMKPLLNKTVHNLLGLAGFVISMMAMYYGYETGYFSRKSTPEYRILMKVVTALTIVLSCYGPGKAFLEKCYSFWY